MAMKLNDEESEVLLALSRRVVRLESCLLLELR